MEAINGNGNGVKLWLIRGAIGLVLSLGGWGGSTIQNHSNRLTVAEEQQKSLVRELELLRSDVMQGFDRQDRATVRLEDKFDRVLQQRR